MTREEKAALAAEVKARLVDLDATVNVFEPGDIVGLNVTAGTMLFAVGLPDGSLVDFVKVRLSTELMEDQNFNTVEVVEREVRKSATRIDRSKSA